MCKSKNMALLFYETGIVGSYWSASISVLFLTVCPRDVPDDVLFVY